jgi:hypothetical protein
LEEDAVHAGHKVLTEVDDNILLIVANPQWILDQELRPGLGYFVLPLPLNPMLVSLYLNPISS